MTLHRHKVDDSTIVEDGREPLDVPAGWQIADGSDDDARVCAAHPWQSDFLVFANGEAYGTAANPSVRGNAQFALQHKNLQKNSKS
jgi:hypothetical protein